MHIFISSLDYPRQFNYQTIFIYFLFIWFDILNITSSAVYSRVTQTILYQACYGAYA